MLVKHLSKLNFRIPANYFSRNQIIGNSPRKKNQTLEDSRHQSKSPESQAKSKLQRVLKQSDQRSIDKLIKNICQKEQKTKQQIDILTNKIQIHKINIMNSQIFNSNQNQNEEKAQKSQRKMTDERLYQLQVEQLNKMECQFKKIILSLDQLQNDKIKKLQALNIKQKVSAMKKYYTLELQHQEKEADRYFMLKQLKKNQLKQKIEALKQYVPNNKKSRLKIIYDLGFNSDKNSHKKVIIELPKNPSISTNLEPINMTRNHERAKNFSEKLKTQTSKKHKKSVINKSLTDDRDKFHQLYNQGHQIKLAKSLQRRRQFLKNKVKQGRLEEKNFLDINANRYKQYKGYKERQPHQKN